MSSKIKVIIVEDEKLVAEDLKSIINNISDRIEIQNIYKNGLEAINHLQNDTVDVLIADINMPIMNGISLAKTVNQFKIKPLIIFITAYGQYAIEGYEIKVFDYILKPYSQKRIENMVSDIHQYFDNNKVNVIDNFNSILETKPKLFVKDGETERILKLDDIYFINSDLRTSTINTLNGVYKSLSSISELENILLDHNFFRCHKSYIVNLNYVDSIISQGISSYNIILKDSNIHIPLGRRKVKEFKIKMNIL